jgi:hypothetical protein
MCDPIHNRQNGIMNVDGAVFWMDPDSAPGDRALAAGGGGYPHPPPLYIPFVILHRKTKTTRHENGPTAHG